MENKIKNYICSIGLTESDAQYYIDNGFNLEQTKKDIEKTNNFFVDNINAITMKKELPLSRLIRAVKEDDNQIAKIKIAERLATMGGYDSIDEVEDWVRRWFAEETWVGEWSHREYDKYMKVAEEIFYLQWEIKEYQDYEKEELYESVYEAIEEEYGVIVKGYPVNFVKTYPNGISEYNVKVDGKKYTVYSEL